MCVSSNNVEKYKMPQIEQSGITAVQVPVVVTTISHTNNNSSNDGGRTKTYEEVFEQPDVDRQNELVIEWLQARRQSLEQLDIEDVQRLVEKADDQ